MNPEFRLSESERHILANLIRKYPRLFAKIFIQIAIYIIEDRRVRGRK